MNKLAKPIMATLLAGLPFLASPVFAFSKSSEAPIVSNSNYVSAGKETFSISVNQVNNSEVIRLIIYKMEAKRLTVRLKTADGTTIDSFNTGKAQDQTGKDYNFRDADEGTYILEVSDGKATVAKQIKLQHVKVKEDTKLSIQ